MLNKNFFFKNFFTNSKKFQMDLLKTKRVFQNLKIEIDNFDLPVLRSYEKNYVFDFDKKMIEKFSKFNNIVIIGMGGSILGTKSIYSYFKKKIKKKIFFFDNLDINLYLHSSFIKKLKNTCFIIVSKSGNTLETLTNFHLLFSKNLNKSGLVFITETQDSSLISLANKFNAEVIEYPSFVGGRYSVLSEVSMFPASLMGLDINKFRNLKMLMKNKNFTSMLIQHVASINTLNSKGFNNSVIFSYDSNLHDLGYWYQQLVGESLGKKGKGITPILSFGPKDHHSLLQLYLDGPKNKFFTFFKSVNNDKKNVKLNYIIRAQYNAIKNVFKLKKIPFREIIFKKNSEEEIGSIFTFFVLETIILSRLMNVNPFDQPAVEQVKIETKKFLR